MGWVKGFGRRTGDGRLKLDVSLDGGDAWSCMGVAWELDQVASNDEIIGHIVRGKMGPRWLRAVQGG